MPDDYRVYDVHIRNNRSNEILADLSLELPTWLVRMATRTEDGIVLSGTDEAAQKVLVEHFRENSPTNRSLWWRDVSWSDITIEPR